MTTVSPPVAFITGAARRIGAQITRHFHQAGYQVVIHFHQSRQQAGALARSLNATRPGSAVTLAANLNDHKQTIQLGQAALAAFGRLDVLVNNASSFYATPLGSLTQAQWLDLSNSNARAALFLAQQLAPALGASRGSIVNITDINAERGMGGFSAYTMAKGALHALTRSLARELAPEVRVNSVSPGAILWPEAAAEGSLPAEGSLCAEGSLSAEGSLFADGSLPAEGSLCADAKARVLAGIPLGHLGSPADIAGAVLFLARDAHYITGQSLRVDGGRNLC